MAFTFFGVSSHTLLLGYIMPYTVHNPVSISTIGLAYFAFARHYLRNLS